jgi:hypothetical protein
LLSEKSALLMASWLKVMSPLEFFVVIIPFITKRAIKRMAPKANLRLIDFFIGIEF